MPACRSTQSTWRLGLGIVAGCFGVAAHRHVRCNPCRRRCVSIGVQVRTHLRNMVIIPEMIGSVVGVYNGKTFNQVRCCCGALTAGTAQQTS